MALDAHPSSYSGSAWKAFFRNRTVVSGAGRLIAIMLCQLFPDKSVTPAFALGAFRRQNSFGEIFTAALRAAGLVPDTFLPEYGPRQFEVTVMPQPALTAADHAVVTREMARATAHRLGQRV